MIVDNTTMQLVSKPQQFDVMVMKITYNEVDAQIMNVSHPAKIDLNKKWLPKQKTNQNFDSDAQGFRKTRNENPPMREIGVAS